MQEETIAQEEVSLRDYLDLLRRRSAIIIQTVVAALVIGIVVAVVSSAVYSSGGRLLVAPSVQGNVIRNNSDPIGAIAENSQVHNVETQLEVLMNNQLVGDAFKAAGVTPGDPRVRVSVARRSEDIDIIDVSSEAHDAKVAQDVAENLMLLYIKEEGLQRTGDIDEAIKYAEKQIKDSNDTWREASIQLQMFKAHNKLADTTNILTTTANTLSSLNSKDAEYRASLVGDQKFIDETEANLARMPSVLLRQTKATNPAIESMKNELNKMESDYSQKIALYKPDHPIMKALKAQIDKHKSQIADLASNHPTVSTEEKSTNGMIEENREKLRNMRAEMAKLQATMNANTKEMNSVQAKQLAMTKEEYQAALLQQKITIAQDQVKMLEGKLSDLNLRHIAQPHPISILNHAGLSPVAVRPKRPLIIFMSVLAGLFLGICFALLAEFMDDRVNAPEDARRLLGVPALGYIPRVEKEDQRMLTAKNAGGSLLESYRVLRSNVRFAAVGEPLHTIMVTSTAPGEGKSVTAANLAIAMALDGKKVILVDADLRRPTVHEKFGVRNTPGLTNVLVGAMSIDLALQQTEVENLKLMTSGPIPPNPAELLNSRSFEQVVEQMKDRADVVILDSPPCLSVADAQVLAATVDGLIYVVQLGSTRKSALKHGHELLRQAHAKILGVVYNKVQVDGRRNDYYYGYYSYYHKTELPSKGGNGNGNGSNGGSSRSSEWEGLLTQAKETTATIAEAPKKRGKSSDTDESEKG